MDTQSVERLEFNRVREKLAAACDTVYGGERALKLWPDQNRGIILRRLDQTHEAMIFIQAAGGRRLLTGLGDIRPLIERLEQGGILEGGELLQIAKTLEAVRDLKKISIDPEIWPWLHHRVESLWVDSIPIREINRCINEKGEIRDQASPELERVRKRVRALEKEIPRRLDEMIKDPLKEQLFQDKLVTLRNDRYVVPLKTEELWQFPSVIQGRSDSGATLFVEPMDVLESNNELMQARLQEKDEMFRILRDLAQMLAGNLDSIGSLIDDLGELDVVLGQGRLAMELDAVMPQYSETGEIKILNGRHPLIDRDKVVPMDIIMDADTRALVMSGPNGGGKTVCLKMMGLFQLMFQAGMMIPASEGTALCLFEQVFALIGDEQSIERHLSSFTSHIEGLQRVLKQSDSRTLALVDEIGAGTDPQEGGALGCAIIERLAALGARVMVTSHQNLLKIYAAQKQGWANARMEFDEASGAPTFKVTMGLPGRSFGISMARKSGLEQEVINKAEEILRSDRHSMEDILDQLDRVRAQLEQERKSIEAERSTLAKERDEMSKAAGEERQRRENILLEAYRKAEQIVRETRIQAMDILDRAQAAVRLPQIAQARGAVKALEQKVTQKVREVEPAPANLAQLKNLKPGDKVKLRGVSKPAEIVEPPDGSGEVSVTVGGMRIRVPLRDIASISNDKTVMDPGIRVKRQASTQLEPELDIHGMYVQEAVERLDEYINNAYLDELREIRIIHGVGTGRLRAATHELLRHHVLVQGFRTSDLNEGGAGATIVILYPRT